MSLDFLDIPSSDNIDLTEDLTSLHDPRFILPPVSQVHHIITFMPTIIIVYDF